jgi:hypothetical protein
MNHSHFQIRRLRVIKSGLAAYDQVFHAGVNIIRGENGSGKSTIADFIFYILGGEFENWKTVAGDCDEVQAEILTKQGAITLRREIAKSQTPINVFFGSMVDAETHALDGWERYPIRRSENRESFSQILFRASGIPEAKSQSASNITMHQILRLLYSDQRTPSALLFKYEPFDTREIREAVGDLLCGLSVYELYEAELNLRDLEKQFEDKNRRFSALLSALPPEESLARIENINQRQSELTLESERVKSEIMNAETYVDQTQVDTFLKARVKLADEVRKYRDKVNSNDENAHLVELEIADLTKFLDYLEELAEKVSRAEGSADIVGGIEFTHCPACLRVLDEDHGARHCVLCGAETDPEQERSRYLQIKLDLEIQLRESRQLLKEKEKKLSQLGRDTRRARTAYEERLTDYAVRFDYSTSPRESFVAQRYQRLGQIEGELARLERLRDRATELERLSAEKSDLQGKINAVADRLKALETASKQRRSQALTQVSEIVKWLLRDDLDRQDEFKNVQNVSVNFPDNSILVDGELNFAESSNVIVKNSAILGLFLAACRDERFYHPRFVLFDNIEDKGMEQDRSHNFQSLIAAASAELKQDHQIIFTTSMITPALENDKFVIGPHYTHERRTLDIGLPIAQANLPLSN